MGGHATHSKSVFVMDLPLHNTFPILHVFRGCDPAPEGAMRIKQRVLHTQRGKDMCMTEPIEGFTGYPFEYGPEYDHTQIAVHRSGAGGGVRSARLGWLGWKTR